MLKKEQTDCEHVSINRVLDSYLCNECGVEFRPVNVEHPIP